MGNEKQIVKIHINKKKKHKKNTILTKPVLALAILAGLILLFNQMQINSVSAMLGSSTSPTGFMQSGTSSSGDKNLENINIDELKSTGHTLAAVFPVEDIQTPDDAMAIIFPTGTPEYGEELGVSFDNPIESLAVLARMYRGLKAEVEKNNPEAWQRYMNLASKPVGISCEYCCGLKAVGIDRNGNSACGCQHNPALLTVALYLTAYTDYNDGEILREVMRWKTLFFPKNMMELGMTVAGGDTSKLDNLPGIVGGCEGGKKMKQATLVAIVLGFLVLISVVQAFQLNGLKDKLGDEQFSVKSASKTTPVASSSGTDKGAGSLPSNIKNLPQMVGGC